VLEVNVLERSGVSEPVVLSIHRLELRDYVYEKQTQELNSSYPRFWQLRFQPIGRTAVGMVVSSFLDLITGGRLELVGGGELELIGSVPPGLESLALIGGGNLDLIGGGSLELIGA